MVGIVAHQLVLVFGVSSPLMLNVTEKMAFGVFVTQQNCNIISG
jgi:hypothetical protein